MVRTGNPRQKYLSPETSTLPELVHQRSEISTTLPPTLHPPDELQCVTPSAPEPRRIHNVLRQVELNGGGPWTDRTPDPPVTTPQGKFYE